MKTSPPGGDVDPYEVLETLLVLFFIYFTLLLCYTVATLSQIEDVAWAGLYGTGMAGTVAGIVFLHRRGWKVSKA